MSLSVRSRRAVVALAATAAATAAVAGGVVSASPPDPSDLNSVAAQPAAPGISLPNVLSPGLAENVVAQGSDKLENPAGCVGFYGYDVHSVSSLDCSAQAPFVPNFSSTPGLAEANKTEPDKNTYLRLRRQKGADPAYDYGDDFLYQGHETGSPGYITRVNLDADAAHRVTLLATKATDGKDLPTFDGSTWDPWARQLLFTAESGSTGGVWQATTDVPSTVVNLQGVLGIGGYEGIQNDSAGDLWIVEDVGGKSGAVNGKAKAPNSFVYRFVPADRRDLTKGGRLQALQVSSLANPGQPIRFHAADPANQTAAEADADITSQDTKDLHTYGKTFQTKWVTIHDTAGLTPPYAAFNANLAAKQAGATPFKRPENGQFQPGTKFRTFFFDETGDTNVGSQANANAGGWGGVQKLQQSSPTADTGTLTLFYSGDQAHTGIDNVTFLTRDKLAVVEDASDGVHAARNAFDSAYLLDTDVDYSASGAPAPVRFLAEGRDPSATVDSLNAASPLVKGNDGDNEITGIHASDGDPGTDGILGAKIPRAFQGGWRLFWTQQHGDNTTWEIVRDGGFGHHWDD